MKKKAISLALALVMCLGLFMVPAYAGGAGVTIRGLNGEDYFLGYGGTVTLVGRDGEGRELSSDEIDTLGLSWSQDQDGLHTLILNGCNEKSLSVNITARLILSDGSVNTFESVELICANDYPELSIEGTGELIATSELTILQASGSVLLAKNLQMTGGPNQGDSFPLTYDITARGETWRDSQTPKTSDGTDATYVRIAPNTSASGQPEKPIEQPQQPATSTAASPTNDSLTADGVLQTPTVYKINGSNYFKIRDLAAILNGTGKQFSVGYDSELKSVTATTGEGYEKQSGDLAGAPAGGEKTAEPSNDAIYINGEKVEAEVYKIDGSNYFKLRDLGKALDFYVGYSAETGVFLETDKPYSE